MSPFEIRDEKGKVLKGSCHDYISKSATNLNIEHPTQFLLCEPKTGLKYHQPVGNINAPDSVKTECLRTLVVATCKEQGLFSMREDEL